MAAPKVGALRQLDLRLGRLKTGTPPRIRSDSVDFGRLEVVPWSIAPLPLFSIGMAMAMAPAELRQEVGEQTGRLARLADAPTPRAHSLASATSLSIAALASAT